MEQTQQETIDKVAGLSQEKQEKVKALREEQNAAKNAKYIVHVGNTGKEKYFQQLKAFFRERATWKWVEAKGVLESLNVIDGWKSRESPAVDGKSTFRVEKVELLGVMHFLSKYEGKGDDYLNVYVNLVSPLADTFQLVQENDKKVQELDYEINMILTGLDEASEEEMVKLANSPIFEDEPETTE